eukprot:TRINITY_DN911_c0_g1_i1.p1 TRINITY_DN911_c0_g1~~TRINITY_DN911_c0_g1_i1.p1  ORF type:complete len:383 (+),score=103.91 TRINITY_DN911_c0_g1_i1:195-1343(+)
MIFVLSPAKTVEMSSVQIVTPPTTQPKWKSDALELVETLRGLTKAALRVLLGVSDALASLNYRRYHDFEKLATKPAIFAYNGPAYLGINPTTLSKGDLDFAQKHVRIISGLYGVLRPMDEIKAYRLDMDLKLANDRGKDLYAFWGTRIADELGAVVETQKDKVLVNVASEEYFKTVHVKRLPKGTKVVQVVFKEPKGDIVATHAKKARGMMIRYVSQNRIDDVEGLKGFTGTDGDYTFRPDQSSATELVFVRGTQATSRKGGATTSAAAAKPPRAKTTGKKSAAAPKVEKEEEVKEEEEVEPEPPSTKQNGGLPKSDKPPKKRVWENEVLPVKKRARTPRPSTPVAVVKGAKSVSKSRSENGAAAVATSAINKKARGKRRRA